MEALNFNTSLVFSMSKFLLEVNFLIHGSWV